MPQNIDPVDSFLVECLLLLLLNWLLISKLYRKYRFYSFLNKSFVCCYYKIKNPITAFKFNVTFLTKWVKVKRHTAVKLVEYQKLP